MAKRIKLHIPAGKLIILLAIGCLFMLMAGCSGPGKSATPTPMPHTYPASTVPMTPATSSQQSANQTANGNNDIIFNHTYSTGHSYRIQLPATWRGKYTVQESKNQVALDVVTFCFYKPLYVNESSTSNQKVSAGDQPIFSIEVETGGQWEKEKQGPFGYGIELASRDDLVFLLYPSITNDYQGQDAIEYGKLADDAWQRIGKTFEFEDDN
jgi:hypothetical protein